MPNFIFKGRGSTGQQVDGELEGANSAAVAGQLVGRGVTPISIVEKKIQVDILAEIRSKLSLDSVSTEELLMFSRQMGTMSKAGIPITRAISGILGVVENPLLIKALGDVLVQLESGRSLSIGCARHPKVFSNIYISMLQVGESTGRLDESFALMAEYIDRNRRTANNIKAALRYPTIVI
ncbi:MAG: type II secretion system F family protein, partial [Gammaproteobacteria bacterium]|nr:type II secretion system F family protein [Gammaproteobacteria bacterium]